MREIPFPDTAALSAARTRQAVLTKPAGALGRLEDLACWFAARQGRTIPAAIVPAITIFARLGKVFFSASVAAPRSTCSRERSTRG